MKRRWFVLALTCILLIPGGQAIAEETDDRRAEAAEIAATLLAAFEAEGCPFEEFGFEPFDIGSTELGLPIRDQSDPLITYWPIYSDSKAVALVAQIEDPEGGSSFSLIADEFGEVTYKSQFPRESNDNIQPTPLDDPMPITSGINLMAASSSSSVTLPIATVMQGNTNNCWAAVVSTIAQYLTGTYKSPGDIAISITGSIQSGGTATDTQRAYASYVYPGTSTAINTLHIAGALSDERIRSFLNSKMPIQATCYNGVGGRHDIAVYGYTVSSSGTMTISIVNPTDGTRIIMSKTGLYYSYTKPSGTWTWNDRSLVPYTWQRIGNTSWYYIHYDGTQAIGWEKISGNWYYFSEYGRMFWDEWISSGGKWYYVKPSGIMACNEWIQPDSYWYHVDENGAMQTGWLYYNSNWYYLRTATNMPASGPQGAMLANGSWYIGGKTYNFNSSGVCTNP